MSAAAAAMLVVLGGCADMSTRDKNTAIGAGAGAVAGAVLTGGNFGTDSYVRAGRTRVGTVGGAAVGGLIGNQVGK